jgi:hypothetical protein
LLDAVGVDLEQPHVALPRPETLSVSREHVTAIRGGRDVGRAVVARSAEPVLPDDPPLGVEHGRKCVDPAAAEPSRQTRQGQATVGRFLGRPVRVDAAARTVLAVPHDLAVSGELDRERAPVAVPGRVVVAAKISNRQEAAVAQPDQLVDPVVLRRGEVLQPDNFAGPIAGKPRRGRRHVAPDQTCRKRQRDV